MPLTVLLLTAVVSLWALALLLAYPAQVARIALQNGGHRAAWERAALLTVGKFAEAQGVLEYRWRKRLKRPSTLIEYK